MFWRQTTCSIAAVILAGGLAAAEPSEVTLIRDGMPVDLRTSNSAVFPVQEFLLGLGDARFPGPHLTRHGKDIVAHGKCSGNDDIGFVCAPGVREVMPSSYQGLCRAP